MERIAADPPSRSIRIAPADKRDLERIHRLRHAVYAAELGQHPENPAGELRDGLDGFNHYIAAREGDDLTGCISLTPPDGPAYSIDKYLPRSALPFPVDDRLWEIRLLTVREGSRGGWTAPALLYAALRWVESRGGSRIVAMGRREILGLYLRLGLRSHGIGIRAGAVHYELLSASVEDLRTGLGRFAPALREMGRHVDWRLGIPFERPAACFHGGAFFEAVGEEFDRLERRHSIINADVLDAWFPPSPLVLDTLRDHLEWLCRTSPPTGCAGLVRAIARTRGVREECILPGAGSSDLMFLALRHWLGPSSRVLVLDPTYGEYFHILEQVVRCGVERFRLLREESYAIDPEALRDRIICLRPDLVILVNPNSPTGGHLRREPLEALLRVVPPATRVWIDETYCEYAGADQSVERFAASSPNVIVAKSLSKVYALSGLRVAYLCAPPQLIEDLRSLTPPWAVSLPAQAAAVKALQDPEYYALRHAETRALRAALARDLRSAAGWDIVEGTGPFLLCHLPEEGPGAAALCAACRGRGLFLRDVSSMGKGFRGRAVRIAIKDAIQNRRIVEIVAEVLARGAAGLSPEEAGNLAAPSTYWQRGMRAVSERR